MRIILLLSFLVVPYIFLAQNAFTYHFGVGVDCGAYKKRFITNNSNWYDTDDIGSNPIIRFSSEISVEYKSKVRLLVGGATLPTPESIIDFFPFGEVVFFKELSEKTKLSFGLSYEQYFGENYRGLDSPQRILSQPGFGPTLGLQISRLNIQAKFNKFLYEHIDLAGDYNYAESMFALKLTYNVFNLNEEKD